MSKFAYRILIASIFVALLAPIQSFAQLEDTLEVTVPFQFYAGDTLLPAGTYTINHVTDDPSALIMRSENDRVEVFLLTNQTQQETPAAQANLVFQKIGNHEFLTQVWDEGDMTGYSVIEPRLQKRLRMAGTRGDPSHVVKAHHKKN